MADTTDRTMQMILNNWSRTLPLDELSGESIVTESDLNRLHKVLTKYFSKTLKVDYAVFPSNNPSIHSSAVE